MKKTIKKLTTWRVGDYVLQLSVVIVGVLVTFIVSDAVSERAKAKEVAKAMEIVKSELEQNNKNLIDITERISFEQNAGRYVLRYEKQLGNAAVDSLQLYLKVPFHIRSLEFTNDALEMLKASSLIQQVRDKELILQIMRAYNRLKEAKETVAWYYNMKESYWTKLSDDSFYIRQDEKLKQENDVYKIWEHRLGNIHVHNILHFVVTGLPDFEAALKDTQHILNRTIERIGQEYEQ